MSSPASSRPLSLLPFLATDGVLLFTAWLIAWRTPDELTGAPLAGVVVCTVAGAAAGLIPFILNNAREREAALAERQRELVDLVNSSTATASRWGTQWASAATGLEDAAGLAARSIATAENLPVVFQEKIDAFSGRLDRAGADAQAREERAARQEAALALRAEQVDASAARLEQTLAGCDRIEAGLGVHNRGLAETLARQETALAARVEQVNGAAARLEHALAACDRVETGLRAHAAGLTAALAEFPAAAARAQARQDALEDRLAAAPAEIETRLARLTTDAEHRLTATTEALTARLAELDAALAGLAERLQTAPAAIAPAPAAAVPMPEPAVPAAPATPAIEVREETVVAIAVAPAAGPKAPARVSTEAIMDPFYIPADGGYASLADAMDLGRA